MTDSAEEQGARWKRYGAYAAALVVVGWIAVEAGGLLVRGGIRPCDRLDARLCADLGPADCELWTTKLGRTGAASSQPHSMRRNRGALFDVVLHKVLGWDMAHADNPLCYTELEPEIYPPIRDAVRTLVTAARQREVAGGQH